MANIAQSVNVISPLMTTKTGLVKQTTWWPLLLFSKYMRGHTLSVHVACAEYDGPTEPTWIRGTIETPFLDASATVDDAGWISLAVVNIHETSAFETRLEGIRAEEVTVYTVTGKDAKVVNMDGQQEVGIQEGKWDGKGLLAFPKHSLTMLRWKAT
jgi:alpha-N-arabinofuranosidase